MNDKKVYCKDCKWFGVETCWKILIKENKYTGERQEDWTGTNNNEGNCNYYEKRPIPTNPNALFCSGCFLNFNKFPIIGSRNDGYCIKCGRTFLNNSYD